MTDYMEETFSRAVVPQAPAGSRVVSRGCAVVLLMLILLMLFPLLWRRAMRMHYDSEIYSVETAPEAPVAVVFGAAVLRDGRLSTVLRDRMDTAIALYQAGKVDKLLVSGDNSRDGYDEPSAMMAYAIARGVAPDDVQPDYAGHRTYDTCYRAQAVFQVEEALLVTQHFHLPRAIFTCRQLGVAANGVSADQRLYRAGRWYETRETAASLVALWDVIRREPPPVLGEPMPLQ